MFSRDASPTRESENEKVKHTWIIAKQVIYAVWSGRPTIRLLPYNVDQIPRDIAQLPKIQLRRGSFGIGVDWTKIDSTEPYVAMVGQLRKLLGEIEETSLACPNTHFLFVQMDTVRFDPKGYIQLLYGYSDPIPTDNKEIQTPIKEDDFWPPNPI